MQANNLDTIAAQATAPGYAGVGIIRISGPNALPIAKTLLQREPQARHAHYGHFFNKDGQVLDQGIGLFFPGPHSFTGEDIFEIQGHGGPVILDTLLKTVITLGARLAKPGEFSERAFMNDKLDLAQAESIADLIQCTSEQAAHCALRSLQGIFSQHIHALVEQLIQLRIYVEAAIDFPEEEIDFLADGKVEKALLGVITDLENVQRQAQQGSILREGMSVVIAGKPNAGKSSLLNALTGKDSAIVTDIAGTTRDVLREQIHIDGIPLHIIDTAGLRDAPDQVEKIGIARAWDEMRKADHILFVVDAQESTATTPQAIWPEFTEQLTDLSRVSIVRNKIDLTQESAEIRQVSDYSLISLSAKNGQGTALLREHLKQSIGFNATTEGGFMARRRHLDALERSHQHLNTGLQQLRQSQAGELLAEDLRQAQQSLGEITGEFSSDDLLGRIFSSFCIGK